MGERVLLDTNVSLRCVQPDSSQFILARDAIDRVRQSGDFPVVSSQGLAEFWTVATRPSESLNGLGYTPEEASIEVQTLLELFDRLPDLDSAFSIWLDLVTRYRVSGKTTHDVRLVATMLANGVTRLLTFNDRDFARFSEITVLTP